MVVFTCAHCGDSIQKPKVEKHYDTKCRNKYPDVCCVDCLKDFRGDEFKTHLKCISEAERYGKKGFVAKENKGEKKQDTWIEMVQSVIEENPNLSKPLRIMLEKVCKQPNTPRKESKFFNFIKSMDPRTNPRDIESAWKLLAVKLELIKGNPNKQNGAKNELNGKEKSDNAENNLANGNGNTTIEPESQPSVENGQKKSKKQKKESGNTDVDITVKSESQLAVENGEKKSKKRKHNESEVDISHSKINNPNASINGGNSEEKNPESKENGNDANVDDKPLSKKERKEKKKREKYEAQLNQVQTETKNTTMISENEEKKSKKRKFKEQAETSVEESTEVVEPSIDQSEPLTKKAKKDNSEAFDWAGAISSLLNSKKKEISMKKLQKKVLTEFCAITDTTVITDRINKKFMKSLKKIENVKIENDKVSLSTAE